MMPMPFRYKHTILLLDDEIPITKSLQRLFRKDGHTILLASSGQEGLDVIKNHGKPVSLIISDQRMPAMTGAQFLEKAKELTPHAVRFMLTGYSDMEAMVDAVNRGEIHRFFTKPWNDHDLLLQVKQSLEQYELTFENRRLTLLTKRQNKALKELNRDLELRFTTRQTVMLREARI
jgi:response regulator RpfG family c-di-GMP phosphodiesterase